MQLENSSAAIRTHFKNLHKLKAGEVKRATRRDKRAFYHSKAEEAEEAANRGDHRKLFKIASELGQCKKSYNGVIKDSNGNKISTEEDKMRRWREHFQKSPKPHSSLQKYLQKCNKVQNYTHNLQRL